MGQLNDYLVWTAHHPELPYVLCRIGEMSEVWT